MNDHVLVSSEPSLGLSTLLSSLTLIATNQQIVLGGKKDKKQFHHKLQD